MKVIKKCLKVAGCFTAFAAAGLTLATNPTMSTYAAVDATQADLGEFKAIQMQKSVDATSNDPNVNTFVIPQLVGINEYTIKVIDPAGQTHDCEVSVDAQNVTINGGDYFSLSNDKITVNVLNNGPYKVVYKYEKNSKTYYSNVYRVDVKNVSYELSFKDSNGLYALVAPTVAVASETNDAKWVKLPTATVNKVLDEETTATANSADVKVTFDGAPVDYESYETVEAAKTALQATTTAIRYINIETGDKAGRYLIPCEEGKFSVVYTYNSGANRPSKTYTVNVVEDFDAPTELTISTPTLPSFELGDTDIKLPELKVSNKYESNVSYNVKSVEIKVKDSKNQVINTLTLVNNDLEFSATLNESFADKSDYSKLVGNYEFTYTIVDAYGNEKTATFKKEGIKISSNPTVTMAYNYTVSSEKTVDASSVNTSYESDLKMEYSYNNVVVPAAWAEDKISEYKDLIIVRTLVDESTREIYYVDNIKYENGALVALDSNDNKNYALTDSYVPDVSKAVPFKFAATETEEDDFAGKTFILRYQVYSTVLPKNGTNRNSRMVSESTGNEYTFKVVGTAQESTPVVRIENLSNTMTTDTEGNVSVKVSATDEKDSRLATRVYHFDFAGDSFSAENETTLKSTIQAAVRTVLDNAGYVHGASNVLDNSTFISEIKAVYGDSFAAAKVSEDNANVYSFTAAKVAGKVKVAVAVSVNDNGTISIATKVVKIKATDEIDPASYTVLDAKDFSTSSDAIIYNLTANVGDTIKLPTIAFDDDVANGGDSSLALNLSYFIDSPITKGGVKYLTPSNYSLGDTVIEGGEIFANKEGVYNVIYSATDDAGNISVVTFQFTVVEVKTPVIKVDVTGEDVKYADGVATAKSGAIIKLDAAEINFNQTTKIQILNDGLYYESLGDGEYQFFGAGTYTVKFNSTGVDGTAEEKILKIKIDPIKLEWSDEFATVPEYARLNDTVYLPLATTNDGAKVDVKVTLGKDGQEVDVTYVNDGWTFVPDKNGVYYVTYTAENDNYVLDDSSSVFTINVGDNVEPKLTVTEKAKLSKDIVYNGEDIEYKVEINTSSKTLVVTIIKNGKSTVINTGLSIIDKNDVGATDDNTSALWRTVKAELSSTKDIVEPGTTNQWFITGTGEVTLKITATDKYDKVGEYVVSFNVVSKTKADSNKDTIVGISLIVVSLMTLAGVISYFAFAGKKGGSSKSRKQKVVEVEETTVETKPEESVKVEEVKAEETKAEVETAEEVPAVEETTETEVVAEESTTVESEEEAKSGDVE